MTFKTQMASDLPVFFEADEFAETGTYNGSDIDIIVEDQGSEEDANSVFDYLDVLVQASDVATVTYRTDTLVYDALTWKYPKVLGAEMNTIRLRWICNQRPKAR